MYIVGKRAFDLLLVILGLIVLMPVLSLTALLVRMKIGTPVFFSQYRPGLHGKPFRIYKFRTMTDTKDPSGNLLPDEERLLSFGRFLRNTSLDELPEFFNVLKGDMSLVGPRPLLIEYLDRYTQEQARRHDVRPGITGWAQVNGRNAISWEDKFKLDVWYIENRTLWLDIKILLLTIYKTVKRENISEAGQATMSKFMGSEEMSDNLRFRDWQYPEIVDGIPTKYQWLVQHSSRLKLGYKTDIGAFTYINASFGVVLEEKVQIGSHCSLYSMSTIDDKHGMIVLKRNCKIGSHSTVMPGVTIGENSIIGAHSLVLSDIPKNSVAFGVPAKVIKKITPCP